MQAFEELRAEDPFTPSLPNWRYLPSDAKIVRPSADELSSIRRLMARTIPPGFTYYEFAREVWLRGYEIFLIGGTLRDVLTGTLPKDADFITTMPMVRLLAPISLNVPSSS